MQPLTLVIPTAFAFCNVPLRQLGTSYHHRRTWHARAPIYFGEFLGSISGKLSRSETSPFWGFRTRSYPHETDDLMRDGGRQMPHVAHAQPLQVHYDGDAQHLQLGLHGRYLVHDESAPHHVFYRNGAGVPTTWNVIKGSSCYLHFNFYWFRQTSIM